MTVFVGLVDLFPVTWVNITWVKSDKTYEFAKLNDREIFRFDRFAKINSREIQKNSRAG